MDDHRPPLALENLAQIGRTIGARAPAFFLDFDGTLAPLAAHPELAEVPSEAREVLGSLAKVHFVCVVSGRALAYLRSKLGIEGLYYAADHGYRVLGPPGSGVDFEMGPQDRGELEAATYELESRLRNTKGVILETKEVSIAVHYRLVTEAERPQLRRVVEDVLDASEGLRLTEGALVYEVQPDLPWNKGRAVLWLLKRLQLKGLNPCPVCIGDDLTDEDMFVVTRNRGVTVVVGKPQRPTQAGYLVSDPAEVLEFLRGFLPSRGQRG